MNSITIMNLSALTPNTFSSRALGVRRPRRDIVRVQKLATARPLHLRHRIFLRNSKRRVFRP